MSLRLIAGILSSVSLLCSLIVLVMGWTLGNEWLTRLIPDAPSMKVNTAVMLSLAALGYLAANAVQSRRSRLLRIMTGVLVLGMSMISLAEVQFGAGFGFAEIILTDPWTGGVHAGQMSAAVLPCC